MSRRKEKCRFWLGPALGGWIGVYPQLYGQDSTVAQRLARKLPGELFNLMVYDDDVFAYDYYCAGKRVDQYCSRPDFFGELPEREWKCFCGRPERFAHLAIDSHKFGSLQAQIADRQTSPVLASESLDLLTSALSASTTRTRLSNT